MSHLRLVSDRERCALSDPQGANVRTRKALEKSWVAAKRNIGPNGELTVNYASFAGMLLETHGVAAVAYAFCPPEPWFERVRGYLADVISEERAAEF